MSTFDALVYTADLVEPTRTFPGVAEYRERLTADADAFLAFALDGEAERLTRKGRPMHPATARAREYYHEKIRQR